MERVAPRQAATAINWKAALHLAEQLIEIKSTSWFPQKDKILTPASTYFAGTRSATIETRIFTPPWDCTLPGGAYPMCAPGVQAHFQRPSGHGR